jgi:hypothetical protein
MTAKKNPFCPEHGRVCDDIAEVKQTVRKIANNDLPHIETKVSSLQMHLRILRRDLWWVMMLGAALAGLVFRLTGVLR